jgi:hypothetical protein
LAYLAPGFGKSSIGLGTPGNPSIGSAYVCLCRGYASAWDKTRGVSHCCLAIYIKKYVKEKEELRKLKYFHHAKI